MQSNLQSNSANCFIALSYDSKQVKQEVNGTMILPPLVFPAFLGLALDCSAYSTTNTVHYKNKV